MVDTSQSVRTITCYSPPCCWDNVQTKYSDSIVNFEIALNGQQYTTVRPPRPPSILAS